jgi:subtilisin-like proprotein convertase family protein
VGYNINHSYGFGLVDAGAAMALAATWTNLPPQAALYESPVRMPGTAFADNSPLGVTDSIQVSGSAISRIEAIEVILAATGDIGDLDVRLVGSAGTESRLAEPHNCYAKQGNAVPQLCGQQYSGWRMTTMRHLGESANQTWTLRVSDRRAGRTSGGLLTAWQLKIHGRAS